MWASSMRRFLECTISRHVPWIQCVACCWRKHTRPLLMQVSKFMSHCAWEMILAYYRRGIFGVQLCWMSVIELESHRSMPFNSLEAALWSSHLHSLFIWDLFLYNFSIYTYVFRQDCYLKIFIPKGFTHILLFLCMLVPLLKC